MKIALIGLPQSGKTVTFNALCGGATGASHGKGAHVATIRVPDERLDKLTVLAQAAKTVYAEVEFQDGCGFPAQGKAIEELRAAETLALVVDAFSGTRDPAVDVQAVVDEMIISDLAQIEHNVSKLAKAVQSGGSRDRGRELEILTRCQAQLEAEKPLIELGLDESELKEIRGYTFLSLKPLLIIINLDEERVDRAAEVEREFAVWSQPGQREVAALCAKVEMEIAEMEPEDRALFLADLGIQRPAVEVVIQKAYSLLGLIPFFTAGEMEARAWTIRKGAVAQKAAGVIHSDIERGFIRAEVISYDDYVATGGPVEAKKQGKLRLEGKEYIVADGDVINFRFNV
ncbi:MAG TPA: DUF933 domain-containing protein [candidate division Zixibacteria bacterium]|nr:DUF933 domain-containing protein [candidate division Zixibacteria bacterium]